MCNTVADLDRILTPLIPGGSAASTGGEVRLNESINLE